ncbi:FmdB family zinc ribbon protein [Glaciimonas soli]|uniref:Zinc ribbon domain-containing protein n=1 Tax=Glaciimonas soli TaxID=2590999 RepID=A0A843YLM2_9BURK|nr:FmdB family zinc ribbon protein [Glaciimonas soli]MQR00335.1 zinc ribbon domain-containing protein [Glaciimonas soli]
MPIYAYRCEACGFAKDALQKMSDAPLTECPSCHQESFKKQVTAAGFQLKGNGWYVTDFRNGAGATGAAAPSTDAASVAGAAVTAPSPAVSAPVADAVKPVASTTSAPAASTASTASI